MEREGWEGKGGHGSSIKTCLMILYYIIAQNSRELGYYTFISSMDKHPFLYKKPLRGLVPRRKLRPVELLANGNGRRSTEDRGILNVGVIFTITW